MDRWINILSIKFLFIKLDISIGNPLYVMQMIKNYKKGVIYLNDKEL